VGISSSDWIMEHFSQSALVPVGPAQAFAYHERRGALQRLIPPWQRVTATALKPDEDQGSSLSIGREVLIQGWNGWLPVKWLARHVAYDPPQLFTDLQVRGPFAYWRHEHRFATGDTPDQCRLTDAVQYAIPLGGFGRAVGGRWLRGQLTSMFNYRHRTTVGDLQLLADTPHFVGKRIAISGASGLVGSQLRTMLSVLGHPTIALVRQPSADSAPGVVFPWQADEAAACRSLEGLDAVVHLAGKSIADHRWNAGVKAEIRSSRVELTRRLCERLAKLERKPETLVCASAIGIYGDRGDEWLDEDSGLGDDFLAGVAREWEAACEPAVAAGIRVVNARLGVVLSPRGGALAKLLGPAGMGLGGAVGRGDQYWSWVAIDDVIGAIYWMLANHGLHGPVNVTAPHPVTSREFAKTLGTVLHRPAWLPMPASALRMLLGEMADALLLSSARVKPLRLLESGYAFRFDTLIDALRHLLGRTS
jgi:uncharacterized protein (TIGR01777 family)